MKKYNIRKSSRIIWGAILAIFDEQEPKLTVRQIFYALSVYGVVPKTHKGYRQTCYQLKRMREFGIIPYNWIADNTRWQIKPDSSPGLEAALERWQQSYRRDLWANQLDYVEIWVEKDALAGVISPVTIEFDVPLYVSRGYGSLTVIYDAAEYIKSIGKPAYIYHFGDFDPSGVDAAYKIRDGLLEHGAEINFKRAAITPGQIYQHKLPSRLTKRSDPRSKKWGNIPSVELDALPAPELRKIVRRCIENHIDPELLDHTRHVEQLERNTLIAVRENLVPVQDSDEEGSID